MRCVVHVDLDCFYVQVERSKNPELKGVPCAVVQYNKWKGGGIIALSYEAKGCGVKRSMRGSEAKKICPDIKLVTVPVKNEKADLTLYREAGSKVFAICSELDGVICQRTSIDEAYIDVTERAKKTLHMIRSGECTFESLLSDVARKTYVLRNTSSDDDDDECVLRSVFEECEKMKDESNALLVVGALEIARLRENVTLKTGYTISAGIARNKLLAKLVSGKHKPDKQTLLPNHEVIRLLDELELQELNGFGGKLGEHLVSKHNIQFVGNLRKYSVTELMEMVPNGGSFTARENTAKWIYNASRGICHEIVESRLLSKSIGCGKTFRGPCILRTMRAIEDYVQKLGLEIAQRTRLAFRDHGMIPTMLGVSWHLGVQKVKRRSVEVKITGDGGSKSTSFPSSVLSNLNVDEVKLAREVSTRAMVRFDPLSLSLTHTMHKFPSVSESASTCIFPHGIGLGSNRSLSLFVQV